MDRDRDRELNLKPLPKPVYKPPLNSRHSGARENGQGNPNDRQQNRQSVSSNLARREYSRSAPQDFPAVPRKVRPTAASETYAQVPETGRRKLGISRRISRMNRQKRDAVKVSNKTPRVINTNILFWGLACLAFCVFIIVIVWGLTKKNAFEIFVNGESMGFVTMSNNINEDSVLSAATALLKEENEADVLISETVSAELARVSKNDALTLEEMAELVAGSLTYDVMAAVIYVDGELKGVIKDMDAAETALDRVMAQHRQEGLTFISEEFIEEVKIEPDYVAKDRIQSEDEVFGALTAFSDKRDIYTIVEGDSLERVSMIYGMTVDKLLHANPDITINTTLRIGRQLNITTPTPILSVRTVEEATYPETEPMPKREQLNPDKPSSHRAIIQQGADGLKDVTYHIIRINGYKQTPVAVNTVIINPPVPQIEEIGTQ